MSSQFTYLEQRLMVRQTTPEPVALPAAPILMEIDQPHWFAAYTSANHEKRVAERLEVRGVDHFLPVYHARHDWKDRRVTVHLPLFPGYVFVRLPLRQRLRVLEISGVARLVGFGGKPAPLPEIEIERLRIGLASGTPAQPCPYLSAGRRVRIVAGPLTGLSGILLRQKGKSRVVISIELIQRSVVVDADAADLELVR